MTIEEEATTLEPKVLIRFTVPKWYRERVNQFIRKGAPSTGGDAVANYCKGIASWFWENGLPVRRGEVFKERIEMKE